MNKTAKLLITILLLALVLAGAGFGYRYLTGRYEPETPRTAPSAAPTETPEQPEAGAETTESAAGGEAETEAGPDAADFTVLDMDGGSVTLSERFGSPIILNFWATWCGPCRSELDSFQNAYWEYGDRIQFMMIDLTDGSRETVDGVKDFLRDNEYSFPVYFDTEFEAALAYNIYSIPLTVLIDADGHVVTHHLGAMTESTLQSYIDELLSP